MSSTSGLGDFSMLDLFRAEIETHAPVLSEGLLNLEKDPTQTKRLEGLMRAAHSIKGAARIVGVDAAVQVAHVMEDYFVAAQGGQVSLTSDAIDRLLRGVDVLAQIGHTPDAQLAEWLTGQESAVRLLVEDLTALRQGERISVSAPSAEIAVVVELTPSAEATALAEIAPPRAEGTIRPTPMIFEFVSEAKEHLANVSDDLLALEKHQGEAVPYRIDRLFRAVHSIKGGAGFFGCRQIEALAHLMETLLGRMRENQLRPEESLIDGLLAGSDRILALIDDVERSNESDIEDVRERLNRFLEPVPVSEPTPRAESAIVERPLSEPAIVASPGVERSSSVRINVNLLDRLMTLAGELVLVRNQALRAVSPDDHLRPLAQRLDGVTSQLQEAVVLTRLQPVGNLFGKFPRMVRDLARQMGKEIELEVRGAEVELDKTILENLSDPLTHLLRNSCDHGIETPPKRARAGKPSAGRVQLSAHHEGGQIRIEVRDDGKGIDPAVLKRKAQENGLRTPAQLARLSDKDALSLILLPGFSTAAAITDVSGRGVGMDVVKTNLEQLGGTLDIESTVGEGTTFHLRLPLTLAIIPCLLVQVGDERFAIPQKDLEELVCVHAGQALGRIEYAYNQEVYRLRQRLLPLVRLSEVLERREAFTPETRRDVARDKTVEGLLSFAVVKVGARRFGLIVDRILNSEEIVVKPMHSALLSLPCYSGATILGDGRVSLILDIAGIARHAGVFAAQEQPQTLAEDEQTEQDRQAVLLFQYGEREQFAVALAMIRRIELIHPGRIEQVGDKEFVTLEGVPTRVLRLDHYLRVSPGVERDPMFLLLPRNLHRPVGILVSNIIDTETLEIELNAAAYEEDGILGTATVRGRMTLFLDVFRLADKVDPSPPTDRQVPALPPDKRRILLVDDTQFFRQVVKGYLEANGCEVETAVNGQDGLEKLDAGEFDLVVSDIEMPVLDGWGFAQAVRQRSRGANVPLLALTTLSSDNDRAKALACGFDRYEVKLDRERFLTAVSELLRAKTQAV
jgi:two-component system chemotaxis sensor kinase CheA